MYSGQAEQDKFVLHTLKEKRNGFFLEIGSNDPIFINNTYLLEKQYDWKGIMIEYDGRYLSSYKEHRPNSIHVINDATTIDYKQLFETNNVPLSIDYLQIDLEPANGSTLQTLQKLDNDVLDNYKFATVTFEHDIYNKNFEHYTFEQKTNFINTQLISREIFQKRGYYCVFQDISNGGNPYEDWYVHPDLVDMNYIKNLVENNKQFYVDHPITEKTLSWTDIKYD